MKMTLVHDISSGTHDAELDALATAVAARIRELRRMRTIDSFALGARVRFNDQTSTKYLVGETATVVSKRRTKVVVRLDTPTGRFRRYAKDGTELPAEVIVPLGIIDLVSA